MISDVSRFEDLTSPLIFRKIHTSYNETIFMEVFVMSYILLFLIGVAFVCCGTLMASIIMTMLCQTKWYIRLVNNMSKKFIGGLMEEEET